MYNGCMDTETIEVNLKAIFMPQIKATKASFYVIIWTPVHVGPEFVFALNLTTNVMLLMLRYSRYGTNITLLTLCY